MRILQYAVISLVLASVLAFTFPGSLHAIVVSCPNPPTTSTIQSAINAASAYDTITVSGPCTYLERLIVDKPLHLVASQGSTIIDGQGLGTVVNITSDNVEIRGFTIKNSDDTGWGIHVERSNGVNITGNTVSASVNGDGVNLYKSNNTLVSNNVFISNLYGVDVVGSQSERIVNNRAVLGDNTGVLLQDSSRSLVFNNTFSGGEEGVDIVQSSNNTVTRNLFKDMKIYGVVLVTDSPRATPSQFSQNNTVNENTFQRNHIGVNLQNATMNIFYHNDFFDSRYRNANPVANSTTSVVINWPNYWDNGTLGGFPGGNYWDDYAGSGAYVIDSNNRDLYPLTSPFLPVPVLVRDILANPPCVIVPSLILPAPICKGSAPLTVGFSAKVLGSLTPLSYRWDFGDGSPVATSSTASHTFAQVRRYNVTLTVGDAGGESDSFTSVVEVTAPAPGPSYTVPIVVGVVVVLGAGGFLFWRRRRRRLRRLAGTARGRS